ncbi:histidine phosphatase family protein [Paenibacillus marinisediminis]
MNSLEAEGERMGKQYIGLVRHGLTDWNVLGKIQGQTDIPLNDTGRMQARLLANRLYKEEGSYPFAGVMSSGMQRAEETAHIIADKLNIPLLNPDHGLRERAYGLVEGTTPEVREQRWGSDWRKMDLGQESDTALQSRALNALEAIAQREEGKSLLLVTHGSWLAQLFAVLLGGRVQANISNLSYSVLERDGSSWNPILFNCTKHMQPSDAFAIQRNI